VKADQDLMSKFTGSYPRAFYKRILCIWRQWNIATCKQKQDKVTKSEIMI